MRLFIKITFLLSLFLFPFSSEVFCLKNSVTTQNLQVIQQANDQSIKTNNAILTIDRLKNAFDASIKKRNIDCQLAFGHQKFCQCLNNNLPVGVDFMLYVGIITSDKQRLNGLVNEKKKLVTSIFLARDKCAKILG